MACAVMAHRALAEREGFEPPIQLPVCRISSAVLSTTQPPLQAYDFAVFFETFRAVQSERMTME